MDLKQKLELAAKAKEKINKELGQGSIMSLSETINMDIEAISTGSLGLDICLGVGGLPKGRIVEIYGPESSGKTTIAIHVMAEAQKKGGLCAIIDAEHAFDRKYAANLGVKIDELDICQPDYGEQGLEVADKLISSGAYDVIVIDSVAALVPQAELEDEMGANKMGLQARMMGQALRKIVGNVKKSNTLVIFINQLREKIGVMFGNNETTSGGNALKFYASVRLDVRRSVTTANTIVQDDVKVGNKTTVKVIKNKVAPPFRNCEFDILYGIGIDKPGELIDIAVELDVIKKGGSWFTYGDLRIQGRDQLRQFLLDNEEVAEVISEEILNRTINANK